MFGLFQRPRPYRTPTLELQNLDKTGLEMEWLYTKEELISTDFEKWNARYTDLSIRGSELLPRVLAHYGRVFDPDGIKISKYMTYSPILRNSSFIDRKGFVEEYGENALLTMAFYCFCGRVGADGPNLSSDRDWVRSTIESLISTNLALAFLLKGIILKHGLSFPVPPNIEAAKRCLATAEGLGVADAKQEILTLVRYKHLSECKPANRLSPTWIWQ